MSHLPSIRFLFSFYGAASVESGLPGRVDNTQDSLALGREIPRCLPDHWQEQCKHQKKQEKQNPGKYYEQDKFI